MAGIKEKKACGINGCQSYAIKYSLCPAHVRGVDVWAEDLFVGVKKRSYHKFLPIEEIRDRAKFREGTMACVYGECVIGGHGVWAGKRLMLIANSHESARKYVVDWSGRRLKWDVIDRTASQIQGAQ